MTGKELLDKNWDQILRKVIKPLWEIEFRHMYEKNKMDEDDFISLAGLELTKAFQNYNPEKSNVCTYAKNVLSKKAMTELRDCTKRDKRKVNCMSSSLNQPFSTDSDTEMIFTIADTTTEIDDEYSELRVGRFVNALSNQQLRVLILELLDFNVSDMPHMLNISKKTMNDILKGLKNSDLTRVLYRRKF